MGVCASLPTHEANESSSLVKGQKSTRHVLVTSDKRTAVCQTSSLSCERGRSKAMASQTSPWLKDATKFEGARGLQLQWQSEGLQTP